jgi:hypothetical protein
VEETIMTVVWMDSPEERAYRALVERLRTPRYRRALRAIRRGVLAVIGR